MALAKDLAAKWKGSRDESLQHLETSLSPQKLRLAESAQSFWDTLGLTAVEAAAWMVKHYKKPGTDRWEDAIEEFRQSRRTTHRLKEGDPDKPHIGNLVAAAKDFAAHVGRPTIETPELAEVESWLKTRGGKRQLVGDFRSFCIWCVKRGKMPSDPTALIEKEIKERGKLPTVLRPEEAAHHLSILESEAPEWIPYYAIALFAFVRPGTRDGEAQRIDGDLRNGETVVHKDGIYVPIGKNGGPRMIPWKFTGPLREWLLAYPPDRRLFPQQYDSPAKAERYWKPWRRRFSLSKDVLRHTGLSAAFYSGASQNELNMAADNSPKMQKEHYVGRWCPEDTEQLWAIRPKYSAVNRPQAEAPKAVHSA